MPKAKSPFSLFKRPTSKQNKFIYYVQFRGNSDKYMTAISSGKASRAAAANWWIWNKCDYVRHRLARGFSVSRRYVDESKRSLDKRLIPEFDKMKLSEIKPEHMRSWMLNLLNDSGLAAATINRSIATLKVMLQEAVTYQYIPKNPAENIGVLKENPKQKDILSPAEGLFL